MTGMDVLDGSNPTFSVMGGEDVAVVTACKPAGGRVGGRVAGR